MALTSYELGEVAQLDFTVRTVTGTLVDASSLTAEARRPTGFVDDITDLITHSATGTYQILLPMEVSGDWNIEIVTVDPDDTQRFSLYVQPDWVGSGALDPGALTSLSRARMWVLRDVTQDNQDEMLVFLINAASQAIVNFIDRQPVAETNVTRTFAYDSDGMLSLSPWELRSATAVTLLADGATVSQTLPSRWWRLEPAQKTPEGTYLSLRFADALGNGYLPSVNSSWMYGFGLGSQVTITGDWGWTAVPRDVEEACLIMVADGYRNPGAGTSYATAGGFTAGEPLGGPIGSIPIGSRRLLIPYKRQRRVGSVRLYSQHTHRQRAI